MSVNAPGTTYEFEGHTFADADAMIRHLREDLLHARNAYYQICAEVDQILGKALGYPEYGEEWFPDGVPNGSVCTGDHVPETLAMEAAKEIRRARGRYPVESYQL